MGASGMGSGIKAMRGAGAPIRGHHDPCMWTDYCGVFGTTRLSMPRHVSSGSNVARVGA
jgi:hypothetical protein